MRVSFVGLTHLGTTLKAASQIRGVDTKGTIADSDLIMVTQDVYDHANLTLVDEAMDEALTAPVLTPVVLVSQVPPGYTRKWLRRRPNIYYQADTIIMNRALERATLPERFIVGCKDGPVEGLSLAYWEYLKLFNAPVFKMSYESAELCKLAVNHFLACQIFMANQVCAVAKTVGADYNDMIPALRADYRIGQGYIEPGMPNQHLMRDVHTMELLLGDDHD